MRAPWLILAASCLSTTAHAQVVQTLSQEVISDKADESADSPTTVTWRLKFAPTVAGDLPWEEDDKLSEYETTSVGLAIASSAGDVGHSGKLAFGLDGNLNLGTDFDNDSDEETVSSLSANASVALDRGFRRISPFLSYGYEAGFEKVLSDYAQTDHTFGAGFSLEMFRIDRCGASEDPRGRDSCTGKRKRGTIAKFTLERTLSSKPDRERLTPKLGVDWSGVFFDDRLIWILRGVGEYRRYDAVGGVRRRDKKLTVHAGLDLTGFLKAPAIKELSLGVRWVRNVSNVDGKDSARWNLLPILNLQHPF